MILVLFAIAFLGLWYFTRKKFPVPPVPSAVLISGAGTGFGRLTSLRLAKLGYTVYSGVLSAEEGARLVEDLEKEPPSQGVAKAGKIVPVVLDITNQTNVAEVFQRLSSELSASGLQCLINNAGIGWTAPTELQPFEDFRKVIEVNLLGHVLMTKTFLPLLRKAQSARIINITSLAGLVGAPRMGAYAASKFGLEGFSDCLRRELRHLDIAVSIIEPGFAKTPIIGSGLDYFSTRISPNISTELLSVYAPLLPSDHEGQTKRVYDRAIDPNQVIDCIEHAFTSPFPKTRYPVGIQAIVLSVLVLILPNYALDFLAEKYSARLNQTKRH